MGSLARNPWRGADLKAPLAVAITVLALAAAWKASHSTAYLEDERPPPESSERGSSPPPSRSSAGGRRCGNADGGRRRGQPPPSSTGSNGSTVTQSHDGGGNDGGCQCSEKAKRRNDDVLSHRSEAGGNNTDGAGGGGGGGNTESRNINHNDNNSYICCCDSSSAAGSGDGSRTHVRRNSEGSNGTSHHLNHRKRGSRAQSGGIHYTGRSKNREKAGSGGGLGRATAATAAASAANVSGGASATTDATKRGGTGEVPEKVVEVGATIDSILMVRRMCHLPGVVLRSGLVYQRVTALALQRQGLVDADIPATVGRLAGTLRRVDLSGNKLTKVPPGLLQLGEVLEELNLGNNQIAELPAQISNLAGLLSLNMAGNRLSVLPPEIGLLSALKRLGLKGNALVRLPGSLGDLSQLSELYLTRNNLEELPDEIVKLRKLRKLQLSFNKLRSLPSGMEAMDRLELCRLAMNPELVHVPEGLAYAERLSWISLAGSAWCARATAKRRRSLVPEIARDEVQLLEKLGSGASGDVFAAIYQGRDVAVKVFKAEVGPDGSSHDELDVSCVLDHPNLTKALGMVHEPGGRKWQVLERVPGKPLAEKPDFTSVLRCRWGQGRRFEPVLVLAVLLQVARAMAYLHEKGICHGDLYAHNVLVDGGTGAAVLCDFGASFFYPSERHKQQSFALEGLEVRAFGLMARDMARRSSRCQWILQDLVPTCLQQDAGCRPSFHEIVNQLHAELMQSVEPSSPMVTSAKSVHSLLDRPDMAAESGRQRSAERRKQISSNLSSYSATSRSANFPGTVPGTAPSRSSSTPHNESDGVDHPNTNSDHHIMATSFGKGGMPLTTAASYRRRSSSTGAGGRLSVVLGGVVEGPADDENSGTEGGGVESDGATGLSGVGDDGPVMSVVEE